MKNFRLGKKAPRHDKRTLLMSSYISEPSLPPIPASVDWTPKNTPLGVMLNDSLGDCTCAGAGHLILTWTTAAGSPVMPTDDQILSAYEAQGYNPADPSTDQGACEIDVLNYWRNTGIAGHQIHGYVQIHPANLLHLKTAIYLFGGAYVGVQFPNSAEAQFNAGQPWDVGGDETIDGGHCVVLTGFTPDGFQCITWGKEQFITNAWWNKFADESYGLISNDWMAASGLAPSGLNLTQLQTDLNAIKN